MTEGHSSNPVQPGDEDSYVETPFYLLVSSISKFSVSLGTKHVALCVTPRAVLSLGWKQEFYAKGSH